MIHRWPKQQQVSPLSGSVPEPEGWSIETEDKRYATLAALLESLPLKHGLVDAEEVTEADRARAVELAKRRAAAAAAGLPLSPRKVETSSPRSGPASPRSNSSTPSSPRTQSPRSQSPRAQSPRTHSPRTSPHLAARGSPRAGSPRQRPLMMSREIKGEPNATGALSTSTSAYLATLGDRADEAARHMVSRESEVDGAFISGDNSAAVAAAMSGGGGAGGDGRGGGGRKGSGGSAIGDMDDEQLIDELAAALIIDDEPALKPPPPMLPLGGMRGRLMPLYAECADDYRGVDLRYELPLKRGDRVRVTDLSSSGWWYGRLLGSTRTGWFQASHVRWFPETLALFVQSLGLQLACYRALVAADIATVRQLSARRDAISDIAGLDTGQKQALKSGLLERGGDLPMHLVADMRPPPPPSAGAPQPVPYAGADAQIKTAVDEMGSIATRTLLCVVVPDTRSYWIDAFDTRTLTVAQLMADVCQRLTQPLEGVLAVYLLEGEMRERRLEPRTKLSSLDLMALSTLLIKKK